MFQTSIKYIVRYLQFFLGTDNLIVHVLYLWVMSLLLQLVITNTVIWDTRITPCGENQKF
jgi:hypothetical protein